MVMGHFRGKCGAQWRGDRRAKVGGGWGREFCLARDLHGKRMGRSCDLTQVIFILILIGVGVQIVNDTWDGQNERSF